MTTVVKGAASNMNMTMSSGSSGRGSKLPTNPIDYPIVFTRHDETGTCVTIFNVLQWLLPAFQLAGWISKHIHKEKEEDDKDAVIPGGSKMLEDISIEVKETRRLFTYFEPFFVVESKVIPNGALLYIVQTFRFPTPRGPRNITRAFVETPGKYFSPLQIEKGGGHFLSCYEDKRLLQCFTYIQLDKLRFAWVAMKELLEEHKAIQRTDGSLTGLARRDIKKNNSNCNDTMNGYVDNVSTTSLTLSPLSSAAAAALPASIMKKTNPGHNIITGPTAEARKTREELREKKYLSELLREECAARWPHTPVHKSVIFIVEEQQMEGVGGRKGRNGPRTYLATVELPLLNKKGEVAKFKGTRWCTTRRDAENAAAEVALRTLRTMKS